MWDSVNKNAAESRVSQLEGDFWKPLIEAGARHCRFENTAESAWAIIRDVTGDSEVRLPYQESVEAERRIGFQPQNTPEGMVKQCLRRLLQFFYDLLGL